MKILHLVCNSHLDPVWQWDWNEGAAAALATFYSAANLADRYDYIFCHNEVLLYEYVEKYDPELFARIQKLVKCGRWKIMGGWYVQPDCLVPSGESFIRQITLGREYFKDKFDERPTAALNFDSFGHTKGIPSILKKCGYDSYIFCRPMNWLHPFDKEDLPHGPFLWEGYDGSRVKTLRYEDESIYCSPYGHAKESIIRKQKHYDDQDSSVILWGVGNHGGVSSAKDLEDIMVLQDEKKGEWEIIHSTLEDYFASVEPETVYTKQLICFMKSYSSANCIKLAHDQLENALYLAEKMCSAAELEADYKYDKMVFKDAERVLCQIEFHDVLSGTAIKTGTDSSIRKAYHAIEELKGEMFGAFSKLAAHLPKVTPRDDNIVVFNPYPYEYDGNVEAEFFVEDALCSNTERYDFKVYDKDGAEIPFQIIKEESYINMDRRKRLLMKVKVPAFGVASYGISRSIVPIEKKEEQPGDIVVSGCGRTVVISRETGLITSFKVSGKEYLKGGAFELDTLNDNGDPWGWRLKKLGEIPKGWMYTGDESQWKYTDSDYRKMEPDGSGKGVFDGLSAVHVTEDGPLMQEVQALFTLGESHAVICYKIYKNSPAVDVNIHVLWNEKERALKLKVPAASEGYFAQMAFGVENYEANGYEYPCNRYVGVKSGANALVIYNNCGIHSSSMDERGLFLTLLNGSAYCAHPTDETRTLIPDPTRFVGNIEQGTHDFSFRVMVNDPAECEKYACEFNQRPYTLLYFPHGNGDAKDSAVTISNTSIVISAFKRLVNGKYMIRLYNGQEIPQSAVLNVMGTSFKADFGKFEFKTFLYDREKDEITESELSDLY